MKKKTLISDYYRKRFEEVKKKVPDEEPLPLTPVNIQDFSTIDALIEEDRDHERKKWEEDTSPNE